MPIHEKNAIKRESARGECRRSGDKEIIISGGKVMRGSGREKKGARFGAPRHRSVRTSAAAEEKRFQLFATWRLRASKLVLVILENRVLTLRFVLGRGGGPRKVTRGEVPECCSWSFGAAMIRQLWRYSGLVGFVNEGTSNGVERKICGSSWEFIFPNAKNMFL